MRLWASQHGLSVDEVVVEVDEEVVVEVDGGLVRDMTEALTSFSTASTRGEVHATGRFGQ